MRKLMLPMFAAFLFAFGLTATADAKPGNVCKPGAKKCVKGYKHVCAGGKRWQKTSDKCGKKKKACVHIRLHCNANSKILKTVCGKNKTHAITGHVSKNASYITFVGKTKSVTLTRCGTNEKKTLTANTNLCSLRGGCCNKKLRWNDTICAVRIK